MHQANDAAVPSQAYQVVWAQDIALTARSIMATKRVCPNGRYLRDSEDRVGARLSLSYRCDRSTLARAKSNAVLPFLEHCVGLSIPVPFCVSIEHDLQFQV